LVTERGGEVTFDTTQCHSAEQRQTFGFIKIKCIDCRAYKMVEGHLHLILKYNYTGIRLSDINQSSYCLAYVTAILNGLNYFSILHHLFCFILHMGLRELSFLTSRK